MLITTENLTKSDQVPPNQFDNLCKHADDLLNTVSSELPRPPPPTPSSEPPLRPLSSEQTARPLKRPLDDNDISNQDEQLPIEPAIKHYKISSEFYEVEDVISSKIAKHNGRFRKVFLIKWKNYPADANTWEPLCNLNAATRKLVKTRYF